MTTIWQQTGQDHRNGILMSIVQSQKIKTTDVVVSHLPCDPNTAKKNFLVRVAIVLLRVKKKSSTTWPLHTRKLKYAVSWVVNSGGKKYAT